mgnify:FL=1
MWVHGSAPLPLLQFLLNTEPRQTPANNALSKSRATLRYDLPGRPEAAPEEGQSLLLPEERLHQLLLAERVLLEAEVHPLRKCILKALVEEVPNLLGLGSIQSPQSRPLQDGRTGPTERSGLGRPLSRVSRRQAPEVVKLALNAADDLLLERIEERLGQLAGRLL